MLFLNVATALQGSLMSLLASLSVTSNGDPPDVLNPPANVEAGLPVHGNFCGPGYGDQNKPALDAVDHQCKVHDACFDNKGYFDCGCDRALLAGLAQVLASPGLSAEAALAGSAVLAYFSQAYCVCMEEVCTDYLKCDWSGCEWDTVCTLLPYGAGIGGVGPC